VYILRMILGVGLPVLLISACSNDESPTQGTSVLRTVDDLLARVCELGGDCGGSTQADVDQCPAELLTELDTDDKAELEEFLTLDKGKQDRILECFREAVCNRFGGSVLNMSDSDLMEPLRGCE
jgi:hypothetical protein